MYACFKCIVYILILWWPRNSHEKYNKEPDFHSVDPTVLSIRPELSNWVVSASGRANLCPVYLLIHLFICVYCGHADLILAQTFALLLFSIHSLTRLLRSRCVEWLASGGRTKRASEWEYDRWRQSSRWCYKSMQEHATWWSTVGNELCLIGQLCWWAGPRWGSAPHLSAPRGQKAWKSISFPFVQADGKPQVFGCWMFSQIKYEQMFSQLNQPEPNWAAVCPTVNIPNLQTLTCNFWTAAEVKKL